MPVKTPPPTVEDRDSAARSNSPTSELPAPLANRVGYLLARAHRAVQARAEEALAPLGLGEGVVECSPRHVGCLLVIAEEGPLSQQELSELIRVDRTTVVAVVDWLESQGFVERKRNPSDRRAYALEITPSGRRWLTRADRGMGAAEQEFLASLSVTERRQLTGLLQQLVTQ